MKDKDETNKVGASVPVLADFDNIPTSEFHGRMLDFIIEEVMPYLKKINLDTGLKVSFNQIAIFLNGHGYRTIRGKNWTRTAVKRLIEPSESSEAASTYSSSIKLVAEPKIRIADRLVAANFTRSSQTDEFAKKMRDEVLVNVDLFEKHHIIAENLNKLGVRTRNGGLWVNVSVKRLLERIEKLK